MFSVRKADLGALNQGRETTAAGVVGVDVSDGRVGEEARNERGGLRPFGEFGFDHHVTRIEAAHRERPARQRGRDLVAHNHPFGDLADEDWALLMVRRIGGLVREIEQDHSLADLRVVQRDAAGREVLLLDADAAHAAGRKLFIAQGVEMREGRGIKAGDLECHAASVEQIARVRWPNSDLMLT